MWVWIAQSTLVAAALAAAVAVLCRVNRSRPALCHLLWLLTFVVLVAPPLPVSFQPGAALREALGGWLEPGTAPRAVAWDAAPEPVSYGASAPTTSLADTAPGELPTTLPASESWVAATVGWLRSVSLSTWGVVVWLAGALVVLARQLRRALPFHQRVLAAPPAGGALADAVASVAERIGVRAPEVRVLSGVGSPAVWCLGAPRLLWPAARAVDDEARWEPSLIAHELAHLARRDHWVSRAEVLAMALCWWNPLFWVIRSQVHYYAELSCDAWALWAYPTDRRAFAGALIDAQEKVVVAPVALQGLCATNTEFKNFERRLNMIMTTHVSRGVSRGAALTAVLTTALVLPGFAGDKKKSWKHGDAAATKTVDAVVSAQQQLDKAEELFYAGEYDAAIPAYREILASDPGHGTAHHRLGFILVGRGELEKAEWHFQRQLETGFSTTTATYNLACAASLAGETEKAAQYLDLAVRRGFDDEKLIATDEDLAAIRRTPAYAECVALVEKGNVLRKKLAELDEYTDLEHALEVRRAYSHIVSQDGKQLAKLGHLLLEAGEYDEAAAAFGRQADAGHAKPTAYYNVACSLALAGDKEGALYSLGRAAKSGMSYAGVLEDADLASLRGDPKFEKLQQMLAAPGLRMKEAKMALKSGDVANAADHLEKVLANPKLDWETRGWAHHKLGVVLADLGRHEESLKHLQAAVSDGYEVDQCAFSMAASYAALGDDKKAVAHVRHAIDLGFSDAAAIREACSTWRVKAATVAELADRAEKSAEKKKYEKARQKKAEAGHWSAGETSEKWKARDKGSPAGKQ